MHWNGQDYIHPAAASFDQTARLAGTTGDDVLRWRERMALLDIDCVTSINAEFERQAFTYVEIEYFPAIHRYGFRYTAKTESGTGRRGLEHWAGRAPQQGHVMNPVGDGWFYYEGLDSKPPSN
jgi:hypothetical protein